MANEELNLFGLEAQMESRHQTKLKKKISPLYLNFPQIHRHANDAVSAVAVPVTSSM